jgi:carbonic anhydrase
MESHERLILENKAWAEEITSKTPDYFKKLAIGQTPKHLWIGCSDSRVPANKITNSNPGDIFVHRNIANMVVHTDFNFLSVLQYAVEELKVENIIVCGHYGCGGVKAALSSQNMGLLNKWIRNIKDVIYHHKDDLKDMEGDEKVNKLVELNVQEQAGNLARTSIVQGAWKYRDKPLNVLGWVFDTGTGLIKEVAKMDKDTEIDKIYKYDF